MLDEPTSALDPQGVVVVRGLVRDLAAEGTAVLVSSHHLDEVARVAGEVVVLHAGRDVGRLEPGGDGTTDGTTGGTSIEQRFFAMVLEAATSSGTGDRPGTRTGGPA